MKKKLIKKKVILCILDGFGLAPASSKNAITRANTKNLDRIFKKYPNSSLGASENNVGLPSGQFGNSEVGHTCIGAGRVLLQDILRINKAIKSGELAKKKSIANLYKNSKRIHLMGLISPGGVHGHEDHFYALIDILNNQEKEIFLHCILDGRDSSPTGGMKSIEFLEKKIKKNMKVNIASISGRYYAMDRDNRWERIEKAYKAIIEGRSSSKFRDPVEAVKKSYENDLTDEFFIPSCNEKYDGINKDDGFLISNFRTDRVREILSSFFDKDFSAFKRSFIPAFAESLGMVEYSRRLKKVVKPIFKSQTVSNTLGKIISDQKLKQLRIAETEKFAHVTYFFNGGDEKEFNGEDRVLVPSPRVKTYDLQPEMSAYEMTDIVIKKIKSQIYDFILINYANTDMVGHSGQMEATIKAVETLDKCANKLLNVSKDENYTLILTSDHGNADCMIDDLLMPCTTHTTNQVPFIICTKESIKLNDGSLADISPTVLDLMGIKKKKEMTGRSLIK